MTKVYASAVIAAPLEKVWHKVRDFNGLPGWVPAIAASEIAGGGAADRVGAVRVLALADNGGTIREQLLALDDHAHSLSYSIVESPMPIAGYVSHIRLKPVTSGGATFVEWLGEFDVLPDGDVAALTNLLKDGVYGAGLARLAEVFGA
jgi:uncharacterized protein YndB with AHSA1/START domain